MPEVHPGVTCDKSGMSPIVGPCWHLVGRNYDLCQEEYDKLPAEEKVNFERVAAQHCMPHRKFGGWCGRGGGFGGKLAARFVADVSIFDGTQVAPGTPFTKIWRLKNVGEWAWPPGTQLTFVGGDQMSANLLVPLAREAPVAPGEEVDVSVDMIAPRARRRWGQRFWAHVQVVDPAAPALPPTELEIAAAAEKAAEIQATAASEDEADDAGAADDAPAAAGAPSASGVVKDEVKEEEVVAAAEAPTPAEA